MASARASLYLQKPSDEIWDPGIRLLHHYYNLFTINRLDRNMVPPPPLLLVASFIDPLSERQASQVH
jgi:hypothetical protein